MKFLTKVVSWVQDQVWQYQFKQVPVTHLGAMLVKEFRGAAYCVGYDEVRFRTLEVLKTLPRDRYYGPVVDLINMIEESK